MSKKQTKPSVSYIVTRIVHHQNSDTMTNLTTGCRALERFTGTMLLLDPLFGKPLEKLREDFVEWFFNKYHLKKNY